MIDDALLANAGRRAFRAGAGDDDLLAGEASDDIFVFDKRVRAITGIAAEAVEIIETDGARAGLQWLVPISLRDAGLKAEVPLVWCLTLKSENGYEFFQGQVGGELGWAGRSVVRIPGRA